MENIYKNTSILIRMNLAYNEKKILSSFIFNGDMVCSDSVKCQPSKKDYKINKKTLWEKELSKSIDVKF